MRNLWMPRCMRTFHRAFPILSQKISILCNDYCLFCVIIDVKRFGLCNEPFLTVMNCRYLKFTIIIFVALFVGLNTSGQITSPGCVGHTNYVNSANNIPIYYFPMGVQGSLTATPPSGVPGWTFVWSRFLVGNTAWSLLTTQTNVPTSTINNLVAGAYNVTITDASGTVVGCYRAWISNVVTNPVVDVAPIAPDCVGPVELNGTITYGTVTPYSNLPNSQMLVNASTSINICFTGNHTWVSDLAFRIVGPASCGSPSLILSPNPGSIGQGAVCNSGNNFTNLCFSTSATGNLNVCAPTPATLSGNYASYGPANTPINWSMLYGCDASSPGWAVQVYDCIGGDQGSLTNATIGFTGTNSCGQPQTINYNTPPGFSSTIADNTCSAATASIFSVPPGVPAPPIACVFGYEWNSTPYVFIADSTSSLNITLNEFIDASGNVMPFQSVLFTLEITSTCVDSTVSENACFGGNGMDQEMFNFIPMQTPDILPVPPLCTTSPQQQLVSNIPGGTWSGDGIIDAFAGIFDPTIVALGTHTITYTVNDPCINPGFIDISVNAVPVLNLVVPDGICVSAAPVNLETLSPNSGTYSGTGITNSTLGTFDPSIAGVGVHIITVDVGGICPNSATSSITVNPLPIISAGPDYVVCQGAGQPLIASGAGAGGSYAWSPSTYLNNSSVFNPTATILAPTTYTVIGTDVNGCQNIDQVSLTQIPLTTVQTEPVAMVCPGTPVILSATASAPGSFNWAPAAGVTGANTATPTVTPQVTTTYTVTVTDACNLQSTATVNVPVEQVYVVSAGPDVAYCIGSSTILNGSVSGPNPSVQWTTANGVIQGSGTALNLPVNNPGSYMLRITTPLGCLYNDLVQVVETPLPVVSMAQNVNLCPGGSVLLNAGNNWQAVQWSNGANSASITVSQPGTYNVTVTQSNCSGSGSVNVNPVFVPYLELGPNVVICQGESVNFVISTPGTWSTGANASSINVSAEGTYSVTINVSNCITTDSVQVSVLPLPFVELGAAVTSCIGDTVYIDATRDGNDYYVWDNGEVGPYRTITEDNAFMVTVGNECGEMSDEVEVNFEDCSYVIYIPNAFTPDNDGINDVWKMTTFNVSKLSLTIFNRWGNVVYRSEDLQPYWTGQVEAGEYYTPDGIYQYRLSYETVLKEVGERSGNIIILR